MTAKTSGARSKDPGLPGGGRPPGSHGTGRAVALPPEQRRAAIIAAAAPLLRSRGHDVTTRQIAEAAGIAEGTVFRAFPTKQAVVDAVVADACDQTGTIELISRIDPAAPLDERVRICARILGDRLATMIELMIALRMHRPPQGPDNGPGGKGTPDKPAEDSATPIGGTHATARHRRHRERQSELLTAISAMLEPDAARLNFSPERAAHLLRLLSFAGTHRMINDDNPLTPDEVADVLLHGIVRREPAPAGAPGDRMAQHGRPPPDATG